MSILNKIIDYKKQAVEKQKAGLDLDKLKENCLSSEPIISFEKKLENFKNNSSVALIAEVKKASPSKGLIRKDFNPVQIAKEYENNGACAISVLTDEKFFQGNIEYLKQVRKVVKIPVLRKDFIIDSFQIYQTRLMKADIILLIVSALGDQTTAKFYNISKQIGLDVLLEVHDQQEFDFAMELGAPIIGINNRNLNTFEVSLDNTVNLIKNRDISNRYIISESGIFANSDVNYLQSNKVSGVLVGESLMRQDNIGKAVNDLMAY